MHWQEAILSKHEDLKKLAGVAVAGAAVLAAGLGFAGARYALSRRVKQLSAQHDASLAAVQARGRELEQRAARSATRKLARSVVDSACDDLERIVAAEDPKVTMEHIREGVAMTQAGLHKYAHPHSAPPLLSPAFNCCVALVVGFSWLVGPAIKAPMCTRSCGTGTLWCGEGPPSRCGVALTARCRSPALALPAAGCLVELG